MQCYSVTVSFLGTTYVSSYAIVCSDCFVQVLAPIVVVFLLSSLTCFQKCLTMKIEREQETAFHC